MLNVRFRALDGAEGELMANPQDTVEILIDRLFTEKVIIGNDLHSTPKQLLWKGTNICETPSATLKDIEFEDMGVIDFVVFESIREMMEAIMEKTKTQLTTCEAKLHHQTTRGDSLGQGMIRNARQIQTDQIKRAKANTYADYVKALSDTTQSMEVPLHILKACPGYEEGTKLPIGNFTLDSLTLATQVSAIVPAICLNRIDVVEALIARFPTSVMSPCDNAKRTALHYAVQYGGVSMVQFLVRDSKVNPWSFYDVSSLAPPLLAAQLGRTAELQVMMEEGVMMLESNITRDGHGRSLLHVAAFHGRVDTVNYLLALAQTDISATDDEGNTALHLAAKSGHLPVVKIILVWKRGTAGKCDVNAVNRKGQTAFHLAAVHGRENVVAELCKSCWRTHITLRDFSKASPVELATENGHVRVVQLLAGVAHDVGYEKELRVREIATMEAAAEENARVLSSQVCSLFDQYVETPLKALWEVLNDKESSVEFAIAVVMDTRCGLERRSIPAEGEMEGKGGLVMNKAGSSSLTPLMMATLAARVDVMEALLAAGADRDAEDAKGNSSLCIAAITNNPSAIELLVRYGADVNAGRSTPLHDAAYNINLEAVEILLAKGADITKVNDGETPLNSFEKWEKKSKRAQEEKDHVRKLLTPKQGGFAV